MEIFLILTEIWNSVQKPWGFPHRASPLFTFPILFIYLFFAIKVTDLTHILFISDYIKSAKYLRLKIPHNGTLSVQNTTISPKNIITSLPKNWRDADLLQKQGRRLSYCPLNRRRNREKKCSKNPFVEGTAAFFFNHPAPHLFSWHAFWEKTFTLTKKKKNVFLFLCLLPHWPRNEETTNHKRVEHMKKNRNEVMNIKR